KSYDNSKNKKSLLDALYYIWVLGKDEKFLLENKYTKKRIEETNTLTKELINYLYEEQPRKKTNISTYRLKKDKIYKPLKGYPFSTLSEMIGYYKTEEEKKDFLKLTVEVLVNGNIDIDDIEDESIKN
ncbi:3214_t:CDS:2, partial [Scutellospora calospora]